MTNFIAFWLGVVILGVLALDYFVFGWDAPLFLGRKFLEFTEYVAFWR